MASGKTRITIRLDAEVLAWFRKEVRSSNGSYQTAINGALRDYIAREPLEATLRRVLREELATFSGRTPESAYSYEPAELVADADAVNASTYGTSARPRRQPRDRTPRTQRRP